MGGESLARNYKDPNPMANEEFVLHALGDEAAPNDSLMACNARPDETTIFKDAAPDPDEGAHTPLGKGGTGGEGITIKDGKGEPKTNPKNSSHIGVMTTSEGASIALETHDGGMESDSGVVLVDEGHP